MASKTEFPPIRACIFDMDGLLINSEDLYTLVTNTILRENGRPDLPWAIKAQLQGRPGPAASKIFMEWAQLPISTTAFMARQKELQADLFRRCKPLPGVETLLQRLARAKTARLVDGGAAAAGGAERGTMAASNGGGSRSSRATKMRMALATSSHARNYEIKTQYLQPMFQVFPPQLRIVGDDERIPRGRGKPLPDIYLLALQCINEQVRSEGEGESEVRPEECLVFEDSVPGVEAGRRAGMRVVWCPHEGLRDVFSGREEEVLAGRTGEYKEGADLEKQIESEGEPLKGSPGRVGELDDGWAELLETLEHFDYLKYGIEVEDTRYRSESGQPAVDGTTDKELEEMTARADGKLHAPEEGSPPPRKSPVPGILESKV